MGEQKCIDLFGTGTRTMQRNESRQSEESSGLCSFLVAAGCHSFKPKFTRAHTTVASDMQVCLVLNV